VGGGTVVPAADVHAAFMAALQFGDARLVAGGECLAAEPGHSRSRPPIIVRYVNQA
jgi:hypothetical protein